ncbi:MAG: alpha-galactosidase [Oscillospiraceae bacterium]|nr:alpha-galactosidase [Oscillospiraceae bacterium]
MEFYTEFRTRFADFSAGYANGMTMAGSCVNDCRMISEDSDKTIYEYGDCIIESIHKKCGDVTECRSTFTNNGTETVTLEMLSSFAIHNIHADVIHRAASFWSAEGRLISQRLVDMHMEQAWIPVSVRLEKFGQCGSMPVKKWFPFIVLENTVEKKFIGVQLYCASSWQIELFRKEEPLSLCGGLADYDFGHWCKDIEAGGSFTTPKAVIAEGNSLEEVCHKLVNAQNPRIAEPDRDMPVIFNDYCTTWGNPTEEKIEKIAQRLEGKGIKYLVIDAGWYRNEDGNWSNIGDWIVNKTAFPKGLKNTADMIRSYGLVPGLWFEFENAGLSSDAYNNTDHLLKRFGAPITVDGRRFLDMRDPWVQEYLDERVIETLKESDMGYIKIDYNNTIGIGCDGAESLGEGLRQTIAASQEFIKKLSSEMPDLVIENCSSGGHRHAGAVYGSSHNVKDNLYATAWQRHKKVREQE